MDSLGREESVKEIEGGPAVKWGKCQGNRGGTYGKGGKCQRNRGRSSSEVGKVSME